VRRRNPLILIGPGLLVAATGVGAGDLATASIAGSKLGLAVLWAVLLGALLKFVLTEGVARWQLATGETLVEGAVRRLGRVASTVFLVYLLIWSFVVGRALVSACGITAHALAPVLGDAESGKIVFGAVHSLLGAILVWVGGYRLFEKVMSAAIVVMVATVAITAVRLGPDLAEVLGGLFVPTIPDIGGDGLVWTVALLGGVGGTVTLLCYGYWIREEGIEGPGHLRQSRFDLACGYGMTALFGIAMVIVGSTVTVEGGGATLLVRLGERLGDSLGPAGRVLFLAGAWAAVASSLLGVWQSIPYLFADLWRLLTAQGDSGGTQRICHAVDTTSLPYRGYLVGLALFSIAGLFSSFVHIQKVYAVIGALFIPALAAVLLALNGRADWIGRPHRSRLPTTGVLIAILALFLFFGIVQLR
jgi:Mn2+/Fe2+ NRAMP family transporter